MLEQGFQTALVLEDDVNVSSVDLEMIIAAIDLVEDFDIVSLRSSDAVIKRKPVAKLAKSTIHRSVYYCHDAAAYIVSRKGARKLLQSQDPKITAFADWPLHAWRMKIYLTIPSKISLTGRPTRVSEKIPQKLREQVKLSYSVWLVYRVRRLIWKTLALVRVGVFRDIRVAEG